MDDIDNTKNTNESQLKMTLKGKTKKMFDWLKEYYNLGYNAELVRLLIKRDYDRQFGE